MDEGAFAWFEDLRQTHFPSGRNRVPAYLTLFHALPGEHEPAIAGTLRAAARLLLERLQLSLERETKYGAATS